MYVLLSLYIIHSCVFSMLVFAFVFMHRVAPPLTPVCGHRPMIDMTDCDVTPE